MNKFNNLKLNGIIAATGKKQNDVAEMIGVHVNTISNWVNGRAVPAPLQLINLLECLGYDDSQLESERLVEWYRKV